MPVTSYEGITLVRESDSNQVIVVRVIGYNARWVFGIIDKQTFFRQLACECLSVRLRDVVAICEPLRNQGLSNFEDEMWTYNELEGSVLPPIK